MPPTTPVDSDLTGTTLYVLEAESIWRADSVGVLAATWTEKYTKAAFEASNGNSNTKFLRIKAKSAVIYVLAMTQTAAQVGTDMYWLTCLRSMNGGDTWSENGIAQFMYGQPNYKLEAEADMETDAALATVNVERIDDYEFRCYGQYAGFSGWHIADYKVDILPGYWGAGVPDSVKIEITGTVPAWIDWTADANIVLQWNIVNSEGPALDSGDIYEFGGTSGGDPINTGTPIMQRLHLRFASSVNGATDAWDFRVRIVEVDGVAVASGPPTAFDVAPSTWTWLYASVGDVIYISTDHGWHWNEFYALHGANDICVDPQLAGAIYCATPEGYLNLLVRQGDGTGGLSATLDTETPVKTPLRIARDLNSGRLWFLNSGTTLKCRLNGSWSDQKTGLTSGTGLHAYVGGKLIFLDGANIWTSEDYGATVTARKGAWAYANGINAHRIAV